MTAQLRSEGRLSEDRHIGPAGEGEGGAATVGKTGRTRQRPGRRRTTRHRRPGGRAFLVGAVAIGLAACGGPGSTHPVASGASSGTRAEASTTSGSSTTAVPKAGPASSSTSSRSLGPSPHSANAGALEFAQCMRSHGLANYPDPGPDGSLPGGEMLGNLGIDINSASFQAAQRACQPLLPAGPRPSPQRVQQAEQDALAFAQCVRSHGVPDYPDPKFNTSGGGVSFSMGRPGVDVGSPKVQAAIKACLHYLPRRQSVK